MSGYGGNLIYTFQLITYTFKGFRNDRSSYVALAGLEPGTHFF